MTDHLGLTVAAILVLPVLLAATSRRLSDVLPPAAATRWLTATALVAALSSGFALTVLGLLLLARWSVVDRLGHWSGAVVGRHQVAPDGASAAAGTVAVILMACAAAATWRAVRGLVDGELACRSMASHTEGLVVVTDPTPSAYAVHGLHGRVVVSTGMLAALPAAERRVLLVHEAAHLRHRHHLYVLAADIAAAAHPALRPVTRAVRFSAERWADEDAAASVADRRLAARAIARAGLAVTAPVAGPATALSITGSDLSRRVAALLEPPVGRRHAVQLSLTLTLVIACAAAGLAERGTERTFEQAKLTPVTMTVIHHSDSPPTAAQLRDPESGLPGPRRPARTPTGSKALVQR